MPKPDKEAMLDDILAQIKIKVLEANTKFDDFRDAELIYDGSICSASLFCEKALVAIIQAATKRSKA